MEDKERFRLGVRELGRGNVIDIAGDLSSPYTDKLLQTLEEFLTSGKLDVILNFRDLEYISDEAIGQLKWMLERFREQDGDIKIINLGSIIKTRFDALGVSEIFNIHLPKKFWDRERLMSTLRRLGIYFFRRTGLRVSTFVLVLFLVTIVGWFISLEILIGIQSQQLGELNSEITELQRKIFLVESERSKYQRQAQELRDRLAPLEAIGFFTLSLEEMALDSGMVLVVQSNRWALEEDMLPGGEVIDSVAVGDSVMVLSHLGTRVQVRTQAGTEGWIAQDAFMELD